MSEMEREGISPMAASILRCFPLRESGYGLSIRQIYVLKKKPIWEAWQLLKERGLIERVGISDKFRLTDAAIIAGRGE